MRPKETDDAAMRGGRTLLTTAEAKAMVSGEGIAVTMPRVAASQDEAVRTAVEVGLPVVMKVNSPDIAHKSDVGGVRLGLATTEQVAEAYRDMLAEVSRHAPSARVDGVTIEPMAAPGLEVIIGAFHDAQFGPVVMFGLGGALVEVLQDVAFRTVPITRRDAEQMLQELKGFRILQGYRGAPPVSIESLVGLLLKVSSLVEKHPEIAELDLNPVLAYPDGALAVDARIVLKQAAQGEEQR